METVDKMEIWKDLCEDERDATKEFNRAFFAIQDAYKEAAEAYQTMNDRVIARLEYEKENRI